MPCSAGVSAVATFISLLLVGQTARGECEALLRPIRDPIILDSIGPQGITRDRDGNLWIGQGLELDLIRVSADLGEVRFVPTEVPPLDDPFGNGLPGIAYNPRNDSLFVLRSSSQEIFGLRRDGTLNGFHLELDLPRPTNIIPEPFPEGLAFDPEGDGGLGAFWVVDNVMTAIYEVDMNGAILRSFCHPDDPDGCPGSGSAARGGPIGLFRSETGLELELVGGVRRRDRIHRVDLEGTRTGLTYPLDELGGIPGGFFRGTVPGQDGPVDVFFVTVESSAELHVLEIVDPQIREILDFTLVVAGRSIELSWRNTDEYDEIIILRDRRVIATLDGDRTAFVELDPPDGLHVYTVVAQRGVCETRVSEEVLLGPGQVLDVVEYDDARMVDLTEDRFGNIWAAHESNEIGVYTKDLERLFLFPGPFQEETDLTTGIAANPLSDEANPTVFVYNADTNMVVETDGSGVAVDAPFASGITSSEERDALVVSMLFNPLGDGGEGTFWYADAATGLIQERTRGGELVRSCAHPDHRDGPPPLDSPLIAYVSGLSASLRHESRLLVSGGGVRDGRTTRFFDIDRDGCDAAGTEILADGMASVRTPRLPTIHATLDDGKPILLAAVSSPPQRTWLFRLDAGDGDVPTVAGLECESSDDRVVELSFRLEEDVDGIEIRRNGQLLEVLPGSARGLVDRDAPAGLLRYSAVVVSDGRRGDERSCTVRSGPGSVVNEAFAHPVSLMHSIAFDPIDDVYAAVSLSNNQLDSIFRYERNLDFRDTTPSPFDFPVQVAALAVRAPTGATQAEYLCLGWLPGSPPEPDPDDPASLTVRGITPTGEPTRSFDVTLPVPRFALVVFPTGLAWDAETDTIWLLERNSRTITNYDLFGEVLSSFPHPAPIHQDRVRNYDLAVAPTLGTLYLSTATRTGTQIDRLVEVTRSGLLTGVEIPLGAEDYNPIRGFALAPGLTRVVVSGTGARGRQADIVARRLFGDVPPVADLACTRPVPDEPRYELSWSNAGPYDELRVYRGTELLETLEGSESGLVDPEAPVDACRLFYRVVPVRDGVEGPGVVCEVLAPAGFLRGDVEENGSINISDAVSILGFLFLGGDEPTCLDTADVDDSGDLSITDGVKLLNFLFLSGERPAAPYPRPGCDPTEDTLGCR